MIAADISGLLQSAHAAQAGGGGNSGAPGQFDVGHPTVGLQIAQNPPIDSVEFYPPHVWLP